MTDDAPNEGRFLGGPRPRRTELAFAGRIFAEFLRGFRKLHFVGPCVTVFGSARFEEGHPYYALAEAAGARLAQLGLTVLTGGGPGIMAAASKGAQQAGGRTLGCTIEVGRERRVNPWCDDSIHFRYFFVRKVMLVKYSYAFVVLPGGFGTMDEVFETLTLRQNGKIRDFPIVLLGTEHWGKLLEMLDEMVACGAIDPQDREMLVVTDDLDEMARCIEHAAIKRFGLQTRVPIHPIGALGEG